MKQMTLGEVEASAVAVALNRLLRDMRAAQAQYEREGMPSPDLATWIDVVAGGGRYGPGLMAKVGPATIQLPHIPDSERGDHDTISDGTPAKAPPDGQPHPASDRAGPGPGEPAAIA